MNQNFEPQPLPARALWLFYVGAAIRLLTFWLPASLAAGVIWSSQGGTWLQSALVAVSLLFFSFVRAVWLPWWTWRRYGWQRRAVDLVVTEGVWFRDMSAIPLHRIQHVDLRQGPLEQSLGLATVLVYTAAGTGADAVIPGLALADAEALRDDLVRTVASSQNPDPVVRIVHPDDPTEEMTLGLDGV